MMYVCSDVKSLWILIFSYFGLQTISSLSNSTNLSGYRMTSSNKSSPTRSQCNNSSVYNSGPDEKSFTSMSSIYGKNSGVEVKTCAALQEMSSIRIPSQGENWWCILVSEIWWPEKNFNFSFIFDRKSICKKFMRLRISNFENFGANRFVGSV